MMRILLILLAVLIAVLSFVLDQPWLYWAAGALLIVAVGALASHLWQMYSETKQYQSKGKDSKDREKELRELGIMEVRPQSAKNEDTKKEKASRSDTSSKATSGKKSKTEPERSFSSEQKATKTTSAKKDRPNASDSESATIPGAEESAAAEEPDDLSALGPYLEALRRAIGAHTACLLVQDEVALEYRIAAIRSAPRAHVRDPGSVFETTEPLLTASMSRQAVTVRTVDPNDVPPGALGYYADTPSLAQMAVAPVPRSEPATYFLVADAREGTNLDIRRVRNLLARFAEGLDLLIAAEETAPEPAPTEAEALTPESAADPAGDGESPRPRHEIVAEEMEAAQQDGDNLALALVHLNRAESIARTGADAVAEAERAMKDRLKQSAPESRVERFGELTYGIFYRGGTADVEPWAERLQGEMEQATGMLEGGVSIGVAVWSDQEPEALREAATEALRVSYETGDCTIVE